MVSCMCKHMCWLSKLTQISQGALGTHANQLDGPGLDSEGGNWRVRESKHKKHGSAPLWGTRVPFLFLTAGKIHSPKLFYKQNFLSFNALVFASVRKMTNLSAGGWADIVGPSFSQTANLQLLMGEIKPGEVCLGVVWKRQAGQESSAPSLYIPVEESFSAWVVYGLLTVTREVQWGIGLSHIRHFL